MDYWILPSNEETFRLSDYLKVSKQVDWRQHNNFEVGDVIFIYNSRPYHRIMHEMSVVRVNVPSVEYLNDRKYWNDIKECEDGLKQNRYVRLQLIASAPEDSQLELDDLRKKGLKGNLQSAIKVSDSKLLRYIKTQIQPETDEKVARICWNSNGWERPSGPKGKTTNDCYEADNGFGHEEWLLDRSKISADGYHYAFLEPLRKCIPFEGTKDIHLYTFTPEGKRLYVGCILNAWYVTPKKAKEIWEEYKKCGWAKSMIQDLENCGLSVKSMDEHFNVRFRFDDFIDYSEEKIYIRKDDPNTANTHYKFLNKREPFLFENNTNTARAADADVILDPNSQIPEGAKSKVTVNRYERSQIARSKCLEANGYTCCVCGMNFEKVYGKLGKNYIHVHHIVPISQIGQQYEIDPIKDLVPVCPNCHAMLHHGAGGKVLSVDELKRMMHK